jgi:predicted TIM-barrel fold metal-dependent hydrolase
MIIDGHTHIHPDPKGFGESFDASLKHLIKSIQNSPVDKAIILPIYPQIPNEFIAAACKTYPDLLIGFASVNPLQGIKAAKKLERDIEKYKLKGLKLHPRMQNFDLTDPKIIPVFKKSAELNIPVLIDAFPGTTEIKGDSVPFQIAEIASVVPDVNIIIAHAGGYKVLDSLFVAKNHKNIYLDLSYSMSYFKSSSVEKDLGFVIKKIGANRCIYGSDHPEMELDTTFEQSVGVLKKYHLNDNEMMSILGETLKLLIG